MSYIHHTTYYRQCGHVVNTAHHSRLGLFQDSEFACDIDDSKSTSGEVLWVFGSRPFVPISGMCKKANFSVPELQNLKSFRWMLVCEWRVYARWSCGAWWYKCSRRVKNDPSWQLAVGKPMLLPKYTQDRSNVQSKCGSVKRWSGFCERTCLWRGITVVHSRRQRSCEKWSSKEEVPRWEQSCIGLVVRQNLDPMI